MAKLMINFTYAISLLLIYICITKAATTHKHRQHSTQTSSDLGSKERMQDGSFSPRDANHYKDGEHHTEWDHEAILGSVKTAEEFDNLSPEESKRRLAILVLKMDRNSDKFVDRHELKAWILRSFKSLAEEEAQERFEDCDTNGDHRVTWQEYLSDAYGFEGNVDFEKHSLNAELNSLDEEDKLIINDRELFKAADADNDGVLNLNEFQRFNNPEEYAELLPIILNQTLLDKDVNGDKKIDFSEFVGDSAKDKDKEYLLLEKDKFDNDFDKDRDGFLEGNEILSWMLPSNAEIAEEEVDHLLAGSDDDHDDRLSYDEIINNYDLFVGSEATDYGDHLQNIDQFRDEL